MSDMKCPFCGQELEEDIIYSGRVFVSCNNPNCIISDWGGCSKQIITAMINTKEERDTFEQHYKCLSHVFKHQIEVNDFLNVEANKLQKKLDICVKALNKIANTDIKVIEKEPLYYARAMFSVTNNALGRIQDVEQKGLK